MLCKEINAQGGMVILSEVMKTQLVTLYKAHYITPEETIRGVVSEPWISAAGCTLEQTRDQR